MIICLGDLELKIDVAVVCIVAEGSSELSRLDDEPAGVGDMDNAVPVHPEDGKAGGGGCADVEVIEVVSPLLPPPMGNTSFCNRAAS
jgi:hypothetical protein